MTTIALRTGLTATANKYPTKPEYNNMIIAGFDDSEPAGIAFYLKLNQEQTDALIALWKEAKP